MKSGTRKYPFVISLGSLETVKELGPIFIDIELAIEGINLIVLVNYLQISNI
jgi:hypothetical protein